MGTQVQFNMYFPTYNDPNNNASNLRNTQQQWNGLFPTTIIDSSFNSDKDRIRQTILKQESLFRHQLHELHRLYRIQRNLMNEAKSKEPRSSLLSSSCIATEQDTNRWPNYKENPNPWEPKIKIQRQLFNLERPADEFIDGDSSKCKSFLNGVPLKGEFQRLGLFANPQPQRIFGVEILDGGSSTITHWNNPLITSSFQNKDAICDLNLFGIGGMVKPKNEESSNGILMPFGFEGSRERESSYQMSTDSLQKKFQQFAQDSSSTTRDSLQKKIKADDNNRSGFHSIGGHDRNLVDTSAASMKLGSTNEKRRAEEEAWEPKNPFDLQKKIKADDKNRLGFGGIVGYDRNLVDTSTSMKSGSSHEKRTAEEEAWEPKNPFDLQKKIKADDKNRSGFGGIGGYDRNLVDTSASTKSGSTHEKREAEEKEASEPRNLFYSQKKIKAGDKNRSDISGIGGYDRNLADISASPISGLKHKAEEEASGLRNLFDLNVSLTDEEQEDASLIDMEVPVEETDESLQRSEDKSAAETLITISRTDDDGKRSGSLDWFAEIAFSLETEIDSVDIGCKSFVPKGMDYFEFVTLNLKESTYVPKNHHEEPKGEAPTRWGRRSKDFQRDVLPGLASLSRNEVTEDFQAIEGMIKSATYRLKGRAPKARTKRQCAVDSGPPPRGSECPDEGTVTPMKWGKRARRPRRPRCSSAFQSVSLREVF